MLKFTRLFAVALVVAPAPVLAQATSPFIGQWTGQVAQICVEIPYPIVVDFASVEGGVIATVDYPSLACRGAWLSPSLDEDERYHFDEIITRNPENICEPLGHVTLELSDSEAMMTWRAIEETEPGAQAILRPAP